MPAPLRTNARVAFPLLSTSSSSGRTPLTCWTHLSCVFVTISAFVALVVVFNDGLLLHRGAGAVLQECQKKVGQDRGGPGSFGKIK